MSSSRKKLSDYLVAYWPSQLAAHGFAIVLAVASLALVALSGPTFEAITSEKPPTSITTKQMFGDFLGEKIATIIGIDSFSSSLLLDHLPLLIAGVAFIRFLFGALQWFCWERVGEKISYQIRRDLSDAYLRLDPTSRRTDEFADLEKHLAANFSNDIRLVREFVVHFFGGLPREGLQSFLQIAVLMSLNPRLFTIFLVGIVPAVAILTNWGKKLRRRARAALKDFSLLTEWIQQRFMGIETIKHYRSEAYESKSMNTLIDSLTDRQLRAARVKSRTSPMIEAVSVLAISVVVFLALREIYEGKVSGSVQVSFFATLGILGQNLSKLGKYINSNREGRAGCDRIFHSLTELRSRSTAHVRDISKFVVSDKNYLELKDVTVRYPNQNANALDNVSHRFEGGKIYCLCGPSGAGKSSLFQMMLGLLEPLSGELKYGVKNPKDTERVIRFLPQHAPLFPGTILENIYWPYKTGDRNRAIASLEAVELTQLIDELPDKENTLVGEGGRILSGGQTQRLQLARVSYHDAQIYLIDEGTSALDPELEQLVFIMLRRLANTGAVVIMIAHRLAAIDIADDVVVMRQGKIAAAGSAVSLKPVVHDFYE